MSSFLFNKLDKKHYLHPQTNIMQTTEYIRITINKLPRGYIFTYLDFISEVNKKEAIIKALNRMAKTGKIVKLSKGKYYKPESTPFGNLMPDQYQIVKDLLEKDNKIVGYLTGYSIYNNLGLSTQVSNIIQIGKNTVRGGFTRERYQISFIKQKNTITKDNIPFLQILDSIRFIKKIPDSTIESSCTRFIAILKQFSLEDIKTLQRLALKYPPATRALTGALINSANNSIDTESLYLSLNPITKYKLKGSTEILSTATKWNLQ
jgi:hypothetical protein